MKNWVIFLAVAFILALGNVSAVAGDFTIATYSIVYLGILGGFTYLWLNSMGHGVNLDFDITDLSINLGAYFVLIGFNYLQLTYLADANIQSLLEILIKVGVWTNCVLPFIYLILTFTIGSWIKKRVKGVDY